MLLRIRRGLNIYNIAHIYGTSEIYIRKVFSTWIMFLYFPFKDYKQIIISERNSFRYDHRLLGIFTIKTKLLELLT